mmetsp:Transcript_1931/g.4281  ORF Transcript_1931/g.4281 Transcript_1931/m.4281 type:complete len:236 (+) Transcript_1931:2393-3100(+)
MEAEGLDQLHIAPFDSLDAAERLPCPDCKVMRKYYCCNCVKFVGVNQAPVVDLPFNCSIVFCRKESRKKSSIIPIPLIAPKVDVIPAFAENVPTFPPDYYLCFPGPEARTVEELSDSELLSLSHIVFIDSTWRQTRQMLNSSLSELPQLKLATHRTIFWRTQKESEFYLATVEAIYYFFADFLKEKHRRGLGPSYTGELDNLLWFYMHNYKTVQVKKQERAKAWQARLEAAAQSG